MIYINTYLPFVRKLLCITFLTAPLLSCQGNSEPRALRIAVLGDSLTAGYDLDEEQAFPARLEKAMRDADWPVTLINAGVSGDTTAAGLARLDWVLEEQPDVLVIQLGANDAFRGLSPQRAKDNLEQMITRTKEQNIDVILAGMKAPASLGQDYQHAFNAIYPALAEEHDIPLYPFFLEGIAGKSEWNLPDGIHPNARGVDEMVRRFKPFLLRHL